MRFVGFDVQPQGAGGVAPYSVALGADGNLWFTGNKSNAVAKLTPEGGVREYPIPTLQCGVTMLTATEKGLYFTESQAHKIGFVSYAGIITEYELADGSAPYGIAVDARQTVWFTCMSGNQIGRIAGSGVVYYDLPTPASDPHSQREAARDRRLGGRLGRLYGMGGEQN